MAARLLLLISVLAVAVWPATAGTRAGTVSISPSGTMVVRPAPASRAAALAGARRDDPVPSDPYGWPLPGAPRVVVTFDPPAAPWLPGRRGVDLAGTPGEPVLAAGPGTVAFAGTVAGVRAVSIDHAGGLRTTYEPVIASVRAGQRVAAGTPIGTLLAGQPGCPAGVPACLHWGLRRGMTYLDPLLLLGLAPVRLLPLAPQDRPAANATAQDRPAGAALQFGPRRPPRLAAGASAQVRPAGAALRDRPAAGAAAGVCRSNWRVSRTSARCGGGPGAAPPPVGRTRPHGCRPGRSAAGSRAGGRT